jgi:CHAT domain
MAFEIPPPSQLTEPTYIVLFRSQSAQSGKYQPLVSAEVILRQIAEGYGTFPLMFDPDLVVALPLLWYSLNLPRTRFDFRDISVRALKQAQSQVNMSHAIALLPLPLLSGMGRIIGEYPKVILVPDDLSEDERRELTALFPSVVEIASRAQLRGRLPILWQKLYQALSVTEPLYIRDFRELDEQPLRASLFPFYFVLRQLRGGSEKAVPHIFKSQAAVLRYAIRDQAVLSAIAEMEEEGLPRDQATKEAESKINEHRFTFRCPVVVALPGLSPKSYTRIVLADASKYRVRSRRRELADTRVEKSVLEFLVAHRALARNGLGILARPVDDEAFRHLRHLELLWRTSSTKGPKPHLVWRAMREIGKALERSFKGEELEALVHSSSLTCFSEFPIGIGILPGDTAPLCCRMPISYRPIVPLTRTLQFELAPIGMHYLKENPRVIICEAVPKSDRIGRLSRAGWTYALNMLRSDSRIKADFAEVDSVEELKDALRGGDDHDIAVISAHGRVDERSRAAGIVVGGKLVQGPELGNVPKIVCLSACDVSSRGSGLVNISDLLFRQGASVVLAPMIPVDVQRNALLMVRFFIYILEGIEGRPGMRSLDEAWHFAAMSNAVNDILAGSAPLQRWASGTSEEDSVVREFMLTKSVGKLRSNHVYEDTESVLADMARERGILPKWKAWMTRGYLPESAFYAMLGWPERTVLHSEALDDIAEALKRVPT